MAGLLTYGKKTFFCPTDIIINVHKDLVQVAVTDPPPLPIFSLSQVCRGGHYCEIEGGTYTFLIHLMWQVPGRRGSMVYFLIKKGWCSVTRAQFRCLYCLYLVLCALRVVKKLVFDGTLLEGR